MKTLAVLFFLVVHSFSYAQLRYTKLVLEPGQVFSFGQSDILVVDTLIMNDSSGIVLNTLKAENYLHAKVLVIGKNCFFQGSGREGKSGRNGKAGISSVGPCKSGTNGENAGRGEDGTNGIDLLLYLKEITIESPLTVTLDGGKGGNGGLGGEGGSAGSGTIHCKGGDGGNGGSGGDGGFGGNGGKLIIHGAAEVQRIFSGKIKATLRGGQFGKGGRGGYSGYGGLGPAGKNGRNGMQGNDGKDGSLGNYGSLQFRVN